MSSRIVAGALAGIALLLSGAVRAEEDVGERVYLHLGTYIHYTPSSDHEGPPIFGGFEWRRPNDWLYGLTLANNSFGQFTQYGYFGKRFGLPWYGLHAKVTGGLLLGYRDPFDDKIPLNNDGFGVAIVPSLAKDVGRYEFNVGLLGLSGLFFSVGYDVLDGGSKKK